VSKLFQFGISNTQGQADVDARAPVNAEAGSDLAALVLIALYPVHLWPVEKQTEL
jgi:hypothetical protein